MGSSGQKTKGPFANICQAYKNQLCPGPQWPDSEVEADSMESPALAARLAAVVEGAKPCRLEGLR